MTLAHKFWRPLFVSLLMFVCTPAFAADAEWRVAAIEGVVRVHPLNAPPAQAKPGQTLTIGTTLATGVRSRAIVLHGEDKVVMSANSRLKIMPETTNSMTRILQDLGLISYEVERRPTHHFTVDTPFLAAVVKGTSFTVIVGDSKDSVQVVKGVVEVKARSGGGAKDIKKGMAVTAAAGLSGLTVGQLDDPQGQTLADDRGAGLNIDGLRASVSGDARYGGGASEKSMGSSLSSIFEAPKGKIDWYLLVVPISFLLFVLVIAAFRILGAPRHQITDNRVATAGWGVFTDIENAAGGQEVVVILVDGAGAPLLNAKVTGSLYPLSDPKRNYTLRFVQASKGAYRAKAGDLTPDIWLVKAKAERGGESLHFERRHSV